MKDTAEIATLRTMLKNVNRAYSATLRAQCGAERAVKLDRLKLQRLELMSSIAERRGLQGVKATAAPVSKTFAITLCS